MAQKNRQFTPEFRANVVRRMLGDDNIVAMSRELKLRRSVMYRWRAAFLKDGEAGLQSPMGRPPGRGDSHRRGTAMERAQRRIAELERRLGRQALENDFLRRAFKRVAALRLNKVRSGGKASTRRSGK
jgi:transposase